MLLHACDPCGLSQTQKCKLQLGQSLEYGSEESDNVFFPLSGIVSLVLFMEGGRTGSIFYSRGKIRVLDRNALLARSCECYKAIREYYDKLDLI